MKKNWDEYNKKTKGAPRPVVIAALQHLNFKGNGLRALDLGCGAGNETRLLESKGFHVTSVDSNTGILESMPMATIARIEDFDFGLERYHLIVATLALPFVLPQDIDRVVEEAKSSLLPGGVFVGHFFGPEDSWSERQHMNFRTVEQVSGYFRCFDVLLLKEEKKAEHSVLGDPHFSHKVTFIVKKPVGDKAVSA